MRVAFELYEAKGCMQVRSKSVYGPLNLLQQIG